MYKTRYEKSGIHFFDRQTGIHVLLDEIEIPETDWSTAPRTLSIALTNVCDLACHFCYAPKNIRRLKTDFTIAVCSEFSKLGGLEITFGGGEPFLHPDLLTIATEILRQTNLAVSVTTHGHHINSSNVDAIPDAFNSIRFSIDSIQHYTEIRGRSLPPLLRSIEHLATRLPVAINSVISRQRIPEIPDLIELARRLGAFELLIIPEHQNGDYDFADSDWRLLSDHLNAFTPSDEIRLAVSEPAARFTNVPTLITEAEGEFSFAHLNASGVLTRSSYEPGRISVTSPDNLRINFIELKGG